MDNLNDEKEKIRLSVRKSCLPDTVETAVARAMLSHGGLATLLFKSDRQRLELLAPVIYDLLKQGGRIELGQ